MKYISEGYMKEFDEIIQNLKLWLINLPDDEQQEEKPEWERRLISQLEDEGTISDHCSDCVDHIKDFIRQEFKQLALDFKKELLPEGYYPDVKQHTRNQMWIDNAILEALRKRGVE